LSNFAWVSLLASLQLAGNISFWSTTKFDRTILNESDDSVLVEMIRPTI